MSHNVQIFQDTSCQSWYKQFPLFLNRTWPNELSHMIDINWIALSRLSTALILVIFIIPVKRNLWDKVKVNEVTRYERAIKVWDPIDHIQWLHYCEWLVEMYSKYLLDIQYIYTHRDRIWSCSIKTCISKNLSYIFHGMKRRSFVMALRVKHRSFRDTWTDIFFWGNPSTINCLTEGLWLERRH